MSIFIERLCIRLRLAQSSSSPLTLSLFTWWINPLKQKSVFKIIVILSGSGVLRSLLLTGVPLDPGRHNYQGITSSPSLNYNVIMFLNNGQHRLGRPAQCEDQSSLAMALWSIVGENWQYGLLLHEPSKHINKDLPRWNDHLGRLCFSLRKSEFNI